MIILKLPEDNYFSDLLKQLQPKLSTLFGNWKNTLINDQLKKIDGLLEEMEEVMTEAYYRKVPAEQYRAFYEAILASWDTERSNKLLFIGKLIHEPFCSSYLDHDLLDYWSEIDAGAVDDMLVKGLLETCLQTPKKIRDYLIKQF